MDIEMSFVNGMEAAEEIRKLDHEVVIIFITNMPQYVMDGYKVQAFDYILKPIDVDQFCRVLENAVLHCSQLHYDKRLMITEYLRSIVTQDASDLPAPSPDLDLDPGSYCCASATSLNPSPKMPEVSFTITNAFSSVSAIMRFKRLNSVLRTVHKTTVVSSPL